MKRTITSTLLALAISAPTFAGGFWLQLSKPEANPQATAQHAVLVVRPAGCHHPENATLTGFAEGYVDGQRRSVPLKLVPLSEAGLYAVPRTWPAQGSWVVSLTASEEGRQTGALTVIDSDGTSRTEPQFMPHTPTHAEVETLVQTIAKQV